MMSLFDIQSMVQGTFLDGNLEVAGMVMYLLLVVVIFGLTRKPFMALIQGMMATLIFSTLGILNTDITILLIVVSVLGLAYSQRGVWRD